MCHWQLGRGSERHSLASRYQQPGHELVMAAGVLAVGGLPQLIM